VLEERNVPALNSGIEAPVFDLPLLGGGKFSLREALAQSPVVLAFFKVSCPVCQYAFPLYEQLAKRTAGRIRVIGVSEDDEKTTRTFAKTYGVTFPIGLEDTKRYPVSNAFGLTNVPTLFEIAQDGRIAVSCVGWEKAVVEDIYRRHAAEGKPGTLLFSPTESIADFRAG
jgi:peroxiredoxin